MYLGLFAIDDLLTFYSVTTRFDTGAATDADSAPSYRVYEEETSTPLLTGSMALLDSSNTAGFYSEQIVLSAANGFEAGKCYSIYKQATVNSVVGATYDNFQVRALEANVSAIKTKTDNLPSDPADASVIAAAFLSIAGDIDNLPTNAELAT